MWKIQTMQKTSRKMCVQEAVPPCNLHQESHIAQNAPTVSATNTTQLASYEKNLYSFAAITKVPQICLNGSVLKPSINQHSTRGSLEIQRIFVFSTCLSSHTQNVHSSPYSMLIVVDLLIILLSLSMHSLIGLRQSL